MADYFTFMGFGRFVNMFVDDPYQFIQWLATREEISHDYDKYRKELVKAEPGDPTNREKYTPLLGKIYRKITADPVIKKEKPLRKREPRYLNITEDKYREQQEKRLPGHDKYDDMQDETREEFDERFITERKDVFSKTNLKKLVKIANKLDELGLYKLASEIDDLIKYAKVSG